MFQRKHYKPSPLGRLLSRLPRSKKWLWPLYLSAQLTVTQETYGSPALPEEWDQFTIAYCSDIHFGPMISPERVRHLFARLDALQADLLLLGGDYGETTCTGIELFQRVAVPQAKFGALACIGNHDVKGTEQEFAGLLHAMRQQNILVIQNGRYILKGKKADLVFCATDDVKFGRPDTRVLTDYRHGRPCFTVYFPHSPDILPRLWKYRRKMFDLALCGHTHGGQIALFGHSLHASSRFGDRYRSGWYKENGHDIFVSNGVGTSLMPLRLGAAPQCHLITLKKI